MTAIQAAGIRFAYAKRMALADVSFTVEPGAMHGFLGPNGSGKSTLFKILATILPLQQGDVRLVGLDLRTQVAAVRHRIGVVFQAPALDPKLSVRQNLVYGGHLYGLRGQELRRRIDTLLAQTDISDRQRDRVSDLSGGLKRRVELCKGLLPRPDIVLLDEPTTGLDPGARKDLWQFLRSQQDLTVLVSTHLIDEAELLDQITILDRGRVVAAGRPQELRESLGGEVLQIDCDDPIALRQDIQQRFSLAIEPGTQPVVLDHSLRLQVENAHRLVPDLVDTFGDRIRRLALSHPSLEDVYIQKTGHRFWVDGVGEGDENSEHDKEGGR
ncbi:MAG: ABC transporter ATP-binding protein [Planctomycetota bacterium]|jgi:ABC-2 type transport system ATP-binding protein